MNTRLQKVRAIMLDQKLDAMLISSPSNLLYLSGFVCLAPYEEREAYLLITKTHAYILTSPLYESVPREDIVVKVASPGTHFSELLVALFQQHACKIIGIEEQFLSVAEYQDILPSAGTFRPLRLRTLRVEKDAQEIAAISAACRIGDAAFTYMLNKIKPGISEEELAMELEIFVLSQHGTLAFPTIIAAGFHAATPHHVSGKEKVQKNQCVLLDFGVKVEGYCSDMTRTVFVGTPSDEHKKIYETVRFAQDASIAYVQEKIRMHEELLASHIDQQARSYIIAAGFADFPHCSHGIGLQFHEAPSLSAYSKDIIKNGMVFSIEPGIYIKNDMGVRIEDLMVIRNNNAELLTKAPREMIVLT